MRSRLPIISTAPRPVSAEHYLDDDKFHDECAVIGIIGHPEASKYCYLGLYAMQHRGQEGAGIVSTEGSYMYAYRDMGLVADVFDTGSLEQLQGNAGIGHTRYATFGGKDWHNLQPFVANFAQNSFAIAHNGNLINAREIRAELESSGAIFSTTSDTEVILHRIARAVEKHAIVDRISDALVGVRGAYSLAVLTLDSLIAVRDPYGVRPLSLGRMGDGYVVASETCAFDLIGATFIRDVEPGEIVQITSTGEIRSTRIQAAASERAFCVFEYVYFSRPDSHIEGRNVYAVRQKLGRELAKEQPAVGDVIIPVPDSGVPAAIGYSMESGLPLEFGLIRNHYVGRTFIEPEQSIRDFGVKVKLNANRAVLEGKRVVAVDDSIVRGTTSRKLIKMIRDAGAKEVHFRISSPPTIRPCHYGIDTPSREELIASNADVAEICKYIGADSLGYLSPEGMYRAVGDVRSNYCDACFSDNYRLGEPTSCPVLGGGKSMNGKKPNKTASRHG